MIYIWSKFKIVQFYDIYKLIFNIYRYKSQYHIVLIRTKVRRYDATPRVASCLTTWPTQVSTTYRSLASHQFKSHPSLIQALTHTERRVSRIGVNSHWSVRSFRSDYLWEIIIIQNLTVAILIKTSLLLFLSTRFIKLFNLVHSFVFIRICIPHLQ